ncbi:hypothetical protein [Pseudoxanthomonas sp. UC19_8]|uniref:hypothetical protein n=1 Tax=Pseudoxanthomonas sp. UC19_8 TaxID=3350175 RepID=UPI0036D22BFB
MRLQTFTVVPAFAGMTVLFEIGAIHSSRDHRDRHVEIFFSRKVGGMPQRSV